MVDVTRMKIPHPPYLPWAYYSAKDKIPTLKYEVVLSIEHPYKILWISKPQKGAKNYKRVFNEGLLQQLSDNEIMIADSGYYGASDLLTPYRKPRNGHRTEAQMGFNTVHATKRSSGERINEHIKIFSVMKQWE
jgi:hypothetical protein